MGIPQIIQVIRPNQTKLDNDLVLKPTVTWGITNLEKPPFPSM